MDRESKGLYAIKPQKSGKEICWSCEIYRHGVPYRKTFTVYRYGSVEKALKAALVESRAKLSQASRPKLSH